MFENKIFLDDALTVLRKMNEGIADVVYLDPPFFTQDIQSLISSQDNKEYSFSDKWESMDEYLDFMRKRLLECRKVLKETGSIFVHCDRNASHYLKVLLDGIFGIENFQSEIIWYYKRWSNSKKGLLNNHQVILFYSKTKKYKFHEIYTEYSCTTNIDQILQERVRSKNGKSKYKYDESGEAVIGQSKKGVPLSDVWEIPYLNPKAKERVGYPTQKPIILLEQIIKLVTDENDVVIDPFMGSGTTLVAAERLKRKYIGIDISKEAVDLAENRLKTLVRTESLLLKKGKNAYKNLSNEQLAILNSMQAVPVQRNAGIDGFLNEYIDGKPVSIKIQKPDETLNEAVGKLIKSSKSKKCIYMILIRTHSDRLSVFNFDDIPGELLIIDSFDLQFINFIEQKKNKNQQICM